MLKNYFKINEESTLNNFLKEIKDKKNSHYIILETTPESFVDIRTIALKSTNLDEKLKKLKKRISQTNKDYLNFLIDTGDRVIQTPDGYFDFIDALEEIYNSNDDLLNTSIKNINKHEVYALNQDNTIAIAKNMFLNKRINLLPVIDKLDVIGEVRPIDLLLTALFENDSGKSTHFSKEQSNVSSLSITNITNNRPIIISKDEPLKSVLKIMIDKKLPSLIITDKHNRLYSTISYTDVFNLIRTNDNNEVSYLIEYNNGKALYDEEFDLIKDFTERSMKKITKLSPYDNLKLSFKLIGEKDTGHQNKFIIKALLSHGNKTIQMEKEISTGTSDELFNDKVKSKWNIPRTVQELLKTLERKVLDEKRKMPQVA